jgi:hypothetical protein
VTGVDPGSDTVNDAEYVPTAKADAEKLTVEVPGPDPLVGETLIQGAVGAEIDHLSVALLVPPMVIVRGDTPAPWYPWRLIEVGLTDIAACAVADGRISATNATSERTITARGLIEAPTVEMGRRADNDCA